VIVKKVVDNRDFTSDVNLSLTVIDSDYRVGTFQYWYARVMLCSYTLMNSGVKDGMKFWFVTTGWTSSEPEEKTKMLQCVQSVSLLLTVSLFLFREISGSCCCTVATSVLHMPFIDAKQTRMQS